MIADDGSSRRRRPPTLREVAHLAGVHVSTVSRVLRQPPPPDGWTESALRIRRIADEIGYKPNPWAASLRTSRTNVIGAVMPRLTDGVIATMFQGIEKVCEREGLSVILTSPRDEPEAMRRAVGLLTGRHIDGLLLSSLHVPADAFVESLRLGSTPVVVFNRHAGTSLPSVTNDDVQGGRLAAEHLLALGHRVLGVVAGPTHATTASDRVKGFHDALTQAGVDLPDQYVVASEFEVDGGIEATRSLLELPTPPTAIFVVNDTAAIGALGVARDFGLTVPTDLSVVGFNDIPAVAQLPVPLTTIRSDPERMGSRAVELLIDLMNAKHVESEALGVRLIERASTAPPMVAGTHPAANCSASGHSSIGPPGPARGVLRPER